MDTTELEQLKLAANQFYLGKDLDKGVIPDSVYDILANKYEAEGGSVRDLVDWDPDMRRPNKPLPKVDKDQVWDNNLSRAVTEYLRGLVKTQGEEIIHHLNYKYDGSSIIAYYNEEGILKCILGTPDVELCMDRTKNCWNMFPHQVTPGIECIQGEFLVDANQYGQLARNKANGLLNSKDMIEDIENEGFVRVYQMRFYDGNWTIERLQQELLSLPLIARIRERDGIKYNDLIFASAEILTCVPTESIVTEITFSDYSTPKFQVDGVVLYSSTGYHAFKFYYTESAVTTVTNVVWNLQSNGGYAAKIQFEEVYLNDKCIRQASSGGVPNLVWMKMGKGAKIKVILANMTIPKIIEVIEPSEDYEWPVCGCGYQLGPNDVFGSTVKCQNHICSQKYELWKNKGIELYQDENGNMLRGENLVNKIIETRFTLFDVLFNVDRWYSENGYLLKDKPEEDKTFNENMIKYIKEGKSDEFQKLIWDNFYMSDLACQIFLANIGTAFKIMYDRFSQYLE